IGRQIGGWNERAKILQGCDKSSCCRDLHVYQRTVTGFLAADKRTIWRVRGIYYHKRRGGGLHCLKRKCISVNGQRLQLEYDEWNNSIWHDQSTLQRPTSRLVRIRRP